MQGRPAVLVTKFTHCRPQLWNAHGRGRCRNVQKCVRWLSGNWTTGVDPCLNDRHAVLSAYSDVPYCFFHCRSAWQKIRDELAAARIKGNDPTILWIGKRSHNGGGARLEPIRN